MDRIAIVAILLASIHSSVFAQSEYPASWPKLIFGADGKCLSLSGTYHYIGEADRAERGGSATIDRAAFNRMSVRGRARSATLEHDVMTGVLRVNIDGQNITPSERANFSRQLTCEGGWSVSLRENRNFGNAETGHINYALTRLLYTLAEDNSLIVHFTSEVEGRKFLGDPSRQSVDAWYRFQLEKLRD